MTIEFLLVRRKGDTKVFFTIKSMDWDSAIMLAERKYSGWIISKE